MTLFLRLTISLLLAIVATLLLELAQGEGAVALPPTSLGIVFVACFAMALLSPALSRVKTPSMPALGNLASGGDNREQGKVKWFNVSKGYGFVTRDSGGDVFVHFRAIRGKGRRVLREGQSVEFIVVSGDKGPQADDVEPLESERG